MNYEWEITPTAITISRGGKASGCVVVFLVLIGVSLIALGILSHLSIIEISFVDHMLPVRVFIVLFGLFWCLAALRSGGQPTQTTMEIDSFNKLLKFNAGGADIITPFADLESVVVHETKTKVSTHTSMHSKTTEPIRPRYEYKYRLYVAKKDGSIIWLWTFTRKPEATKHTKVLLERIEISCIDEAGCELARSIVNPYTFAGERKPSVECSKYVDIDHSDEGTRAITLHYTRKGFDRFFSTSLFFSLFLGVPIWFFAVNQPDVPGGFLILPGIFLLFAVAAAFFRGRRYDVGCSPQAISVSVHFSFPLFQAAFGKSAEIPATALRAVRVNRYDGGGFHLELGFDRELSLPRITGFAFNSGDVRMLPRNIIPDSLSHIGLWSVAPIARRANGPTVSDLYVIEDMLQRQYDLV